MTITKNLYLLKMGMDAQNGLNHRIRFVSYNVKGVPDVEKIVIDFMICPPMIYKNFKYKRIENKIALCFDTFIIYKKEPQTEKRYKFPNEILETLEKFENPQIKVNNIKYTYNNILILCNYLLQENFNNIILLENFTKKFNYESFTSDKLEIEKFYL